MDAKTFCEKLASYGNNMDDKGFSDQFTEDATIRMGNMPPIHGKANLAAFSKELSNSVNSMHYEIVSVEETPNFIVWQCMTTIQRKNDCVTITFPECHILRREGDKLKEVQVYADTTSILDTCEIKSK